MIFPTAITLYNRKCYHFHLTDMDQGNERQTKFVAKGFTSFEYQEAGWSELLPLITMFYGI